MADKGVPDVSTVASPPRRELDRSDINVGDQLGAGGQAIVYEAQLTGDAFPDRIALKEPPHSNTLTADAVDAFLTEANTWGTIDSRERQKLRWQHSEHIVGVIDWGTEQGLPWIAMEYMDGGSLEDRLAAAPDGLPIEEALWIGEAVCQGIEVAHNYGIAHLDLKPANVLFRTTEGEEVWDVPKVADWGLARVLADQSGSMDAFSIEYAAPEQFDSSVFGDPDMLTDVYQVGALVYAMLTGNPPYTGSQRSFMLDIVSDEAPMPPSDRRSELSQDIDTVVLQALQKDKTERYGSIHGFKQALRAVRTDSAQKLPNSSGEVEVGKSTTDTESTRSEITETEITNVNSITEWTTFMCGSARTGHHPTATGPQPPVDTRWVRNIGGKTLSSPAVVDNTVYIGSSDNSLYALDARDGTELWRFKTDGCVNSSPTVADGTIYFGSDDQKIYAVDAEEGIERWHFEVGEPVQTSPAVVDGRVYINSTNKLLAIHTDHGTVRWEFKSKRTIRPSPAVAGGRVYIGSHDKYVYALNVRNGSVEWKFETDGWVYSSPAVEEGVAYVGGKHDVYAIDVEKGSELWSFQPYQHQGQSFPSKESNPSVAVADGTVYVGNSARRAGRSNRRIYALSADGGRKRWSFQTDDNIYSSPVVAGDSVYMSSGHKLHALSTTDGSAQWWFQADGSIRTPAVVDEIIYFGSTDGNVYAISSERQV